MNSIRVFYAEFFGKVGVESVNDIYQAVPPEVRDLLSRSLDAIIKS